jgi:predicted TIM-barrel fold metal-dependent hydrolase
MKTERKPLFEVKAVDRAFYAERLRDFLPERIIDIHTHVWLQRFIAPGRPAALRSVTWPSLVARDNSIEDLIETYRLLLPGKTVVPLIFGSALKQEDDLDGNNAYVSSSAAQHGFPALIFTQPTWAGEDLEQRVRDGRFVGIKAYLSWSAPYLPEKEIRIFDFIPHAHWEVLNRNGWIVMLHIPRDGRLRDPVNLAQLLEIEQRYPRAKVIVAHVGRAYCPEDIVGAFEALATTRNLRFDFSANTNEPVFRRAIQAVGPKRILFGSDLPILRMRMRRICEAGNYVNIVPRGLYGDVSGDKHMRETDGADAERLTFFLYEELDAFRRAAEAEGLSRADVQAVFYDNAAGLLAEVRGRG